MKKLIVITLFILGFGVFGSAGGSYIFDHGVLDSYQSTLLGNNISVCDFEFNAPSYNPAGSNYSYNLSLYVLGSPDILYFSGTEEYIDNITVWNNSNSFCDIWVSPFEVYCELAIINLTDNSSYPFSDYYVYNCSTTSTMPTSTSTSTSSSSSSTSSSISSSSSSSSSSSLTTTTGPGGGNYTIVTYDTGTLPAMNGGTTPGIQEPGFLGGGGSIFGVAIQSFILICCFLIILIIMCTVKPVYFGILVSVLAGDFLIIVMQLMNIPANLFLLINALAIINFFRGVRG